MAAQRQRFVDELLRRINPEHVYSGEELNKIKLQISRELHLPRIPRNSWIFQQIPPHQQERWKSVLRIKRTRSLSGVVVVAVMTQPAPCPHGRCDYCPGGPEVGAPQSYTGGEPAALRALQNQYDPYLQVKNRLAQYYATGHPVDKLELIIMGGTFPSQPLSYQEDFIRHCIDATLDAPSQSTADAQLQAEKSKIRISGITVETRPDTCSWDIIANMLNFGITRFEMGVQTTSDAVYQRIHRGHTVQDVINATGRLKDGGLKICYHMMPNLPGSTWDQDRAMFQELFSSSTFQPDMLKIYPLLILKGTPIYTDWKQGQVSIYSHDEIVQLISHVLSELPPWVRVQRIQRDIPAPLIVDGPKKSNLHEYVQDHLRSQGKVCNCIRCREIGIRLRQPEPPELTSLEPQLQRHQYKASGGTEVFLSYEDTSQRVLVGFIRLRIPSAAQTPLPAIQSSNHPAFIRELHVYGQTIPVGKHEQLEWQHQGYGRKLLTAAEKIASNEFDVQTMLVTSGLGVRPYYRSLGYKLNKPYMRKELD